MVKALARAFRWRRMLETTRYPTIDDSPINTPYVSRILRLTLLGPNIVEAILNGYYSGTLPTLIGPFPVEWTSQQDTLSNLSVVFRLR